MSGTYSVVAFASIGGILFGLDQGNWGGAIVKDGFVANFCGSEEACQEADTLPAEYSSFLQWASGLLQLGAAFGALVIAPTMASRLGRRETMFFGCLVAILGSVPLCLVSNKVVFCLFRGVLGVGVGHVTYSLPMFISEVAPTSIRGALGGMFQFTCVCGLVLGALLNTMKSFSYQLSFSLPIYPAAIVALGIFFFPMSPRFALMKFQRLGQRDVGVAKARASLVRLRSDDEKAEEELQELVEALAQASEQQPYSTLFRDPSIRYRVLVANFLQWGQQFTGVNAILSYGPAIFKDAGVPLDPLVAGAIVNLFMLLGTGICLAVIDKAGRKLLLILGGSVMTIALLVSTILAKLIFDMGHDVAPDQAARQEALGYCLFAFVCIYAFGFGPWGTIPWLYPSEIFPMDVKEKAMSTSVFSQWMANFVIAFMVPGQVRSWESWGTLLFYSVTSLVMLIGVMFIVPETKGVKMEDMETVFGSRTTGHSRENLIQHKGQEENLTGQPQDKALA